MDRSIEAAREKKEKKNRTLRNELSFWHKKIERPRGGQFVNLYAVRQLSDKTKLEIKKSPNYEERANKKNARGQIKRKKQSMENMHGVMPMRTNKDL